MIDEAAFKSALMGTPDNSYDGRMYRAFVALYEAHKHRNKHRVQDSVNPALRSERPAQPLYDNPTLQAIHEAMEPRTQNRGDE